jgi:MinD-like ATPase involved in chromosome partitioning or flagellar assembly
VDLPTYTSIWRIEKRLYKLYDFRLPMPLPIGQVTVFAAIAVPYVVVLTLLGLRFNHTLVWLYILPPGVVTWLVTRPVLEGKRLPELIGSQLRYLAEPRVWCRMAPLAESDVIVVTGRVWRLPPLVLARASSQAAGRRLSLGALVRPAAVSPPGQSPPAQPPADSQEPRRRLRLPAPSKPAPGAAAGRVTRPGQSGLPGQARAAAEAAPPRSAGPGIAAPLWPASAMQHGPHGYPRPLGRPAGQPPAPGYARPLGQPAHPGLTPDRGPLMAGTGATGPSPVRAPTAPPTRPGNPPAAAPPPSPGPVTPVVSSVIEPALARSVAESTASADVGPAEAGPGAVAPGAGEPVTSGTVAAERTDVSAGEQHPVVTVVNAVAVQSAAPPVEQALAGPGARRSDGRTGRVTVVPGGHRPGKPDQIQRDRARAQLPITGHRRVVVLGCTVGAGQTITTLLTGEMLASLRSDSVAVLDLNPGADSLAQRALLRPALSQAGSLGPSRLSVLRGERAERSIDTDPAADPAAAASVFDQACAEHQIVLADPSTSAVPRLLAVTDVLVLVAPASAAAARAIGMTFEWLEAHGQAELAADSIMVMNGVSRRSLPQVEQAERVCIGRCRAIVRVPWDDQLKSPTMRPRAGAGAGTHPGQQGAGEHGAGQHGAGQHGAGQHGAGQHWAGQHWAGQHWAGLLGQGTANAYTALAGVVVAALAGDDHGGPGHGGPGHPTAGAATGAGPSEATP